ncbi:hypothetical protein [Streptomyces thioluteus]|uniref:hypothetical protein n=1 Tax=Streptomyces thioluteus TaxID=66431 RepID=UPI003CD07115
MGVHLVGGLLGTLLVGLLATDGVGGAVQLGRQAAGAFAVLAYSFTLSWLLAKLVDRTVGFPRRRGRRGRRPRDRAFHAETAYDHSAVGGTSTRSTDRTPQEAQEAPQHHKKVDA